MTPRLSQVLLSWSYLINLHTVPGTMGREGVGCACSCPGIHLTGDT